VKSVPHFAQTSWRGWVEARIIVALSVFIGHEINHAGMTAMRRPSVVFAVPPMAFFSIAARHGRRLLQCL
jgi:hypothetical protein